MPTGAAGANAPQTTSLSLDTLMERYGIAYIDYLKLDIEGAEKDVFESASRRWLSRTRMIVAEFHDAFRPGAMAAAEAALRDLPHTKYRQGENWFFELESAQQVTRGRCPEP